MKKLDLLVVHRPVSVGDRGDGGDGAQGRRLPAAGRARSSRPRARCTASNRSIQWRERVIRPLFESQTDHAIMFAFAKKFGFDKEFVKNYKMVKPDGDAKWEEPEPESILQRDEPRPVDDRHDRPVAGAPEAPHEEHGDVRRQDAAGEGRAVRRRLLRAAVAVLRHARAEAPGLAEPVQHVGVDDGRRRLLPRELRRRARRRVAAGRGRLVSEGRRPHHRLSRARPRADEEARLVGRAHRGREEGGRGQELEDRPVRRDDPRVHEGARQPSVRQREGAGDRLELPGCRSRSTASRCTRRGPTWSPSTRRTPTRRRSGDCRRCTRRVQQENVKNEVAEELPAGADERPAGRVRRRRRRDALEPVARRTAAGRTSSRSTRRTPTTAASGTASGSGSSRRPARRSRSRRW